MVRESIEVRAFRFGCPILKPATFLEPSAQRHCEAVTADRKSHVLIKLLSTRRDFQRSSSQCSARGLESIPLILTPQL